MDLFENLPSMKSNRFETAIWVSKLVLMSIGIISTLILLKVAIIPYAFHPVLSTFPRLWVSARSLLSRPFVYIIVNFIIITIAASSNFHHHKITPPSDSPAPAATPTATNSITDQAVSGNDTHQSNEPKEEERVAEEETAVNDSVWSCDKFITDPSPEKCSDDYFSPESDDKGGDSMEDTWRAIMEGKGKTMKPHLKKSDTWGERITKAEPFHNSGNDEGDDDGDPVAWAQREFRKSETFNSNASFRREKSMSPEELNLRAEEFIKKCNNQMKLQRLESHQRFMEKVNRGV